MLETVNMVWPEGDGHSPRCGAGCGYLRLHVPCLSLATRQPFLWLCPLQVPPPSPVPSSMNHWQLQHPQRAQQTNVALLGRETVGNKVRPGVPKPYPESPRPPGLTLSPSVQEPTGYSLNNPSYVRSPCDPDMDNRYLTTYNQG